MDAVEVDGVRMRACVLEANAEEVALGHAQHRAGDGAVVRPRVELDAGGDLDRLVDGDGANNFYTVNGRTFYYARYPIAVKRSERVRVYLANMTEFDLINSFHLHADFFRYQPTGTGENWEYTDTVMQCQGQRGVLEIEFARTGLHMFHAHQSEFTELGWMGFFNVID